MSVENVRQALGGIIEAWSTAEGVPVALENIASSADLAAPYVAPFLLPAETSPVGNAITDNQDFTGIYQVSVYTEKGKGTQTSRSIVDSLLEAFARGVYVDMPVTGGVQRVLIEASWSTSALDSGSWYTVPVSVRYRSFA